LATTLRQRATPFICIILTGPTPLLFNPSPILSNPIISICSGRTDPAPQLDSGNGNPVHEFATIWGLKFPHIGAVLLRKGNTPHDYENFRSFPSGDPGNRHAPAPPLPLSAVPVRQLAN
jgi:hypothetical protein